MRTLFLLLLLLAWGGTSARAVTDTATFVPSADGGDAAVLRTLSWTPGEFAVAELPGDGDADAILTFPTARPAGQEALDTVRLRWFRPVDAEGRAPAVLVIHTLHPDLPVGLGLCRGLRARGINAFMLELPGYGARQAEPRRFTGITALIKAPMAVADARRSFDVIASRAGIDRERISIQGTSLGSFFAVAAAGLDGCFANTFLLLSGGDGVNILETGIHDTFHVRRALSHYGYDTREKLAALIEPVEPLRLAPRLDPARTWMVNAQQDKVVPRVNSEMLAEAIGLDPSHHVWVPGNHYTAFLMLPGVLDQVVGEVGEEGVRR